MKANNKINKLQIIIAMLPVFCNIGGDASAGERVSDAPKAGIYFFIDTNGRILDEVHIAIIKKDYKYKVIAHNSGWEYRIPDAKFICIADKCSIKDDKNKTIFIISAIKGANLKVIFSIKQPVSNEKIWQDMLPVNKTYTRNYKSKFYGYE